MSEPTMLEKAKAIACQAHEGQRDKVGRPYIHHLRRVSEAVTTEEEKAVAWLHDVVEDTAWTILDLEEHFPSGVIDALDAISRREGETYFDYIHRVWTNAVARRVKVADLHDNMDLSRLEGADEEVVREVQGMIKARFAPALRILG